MSAHYDDGEYDGLCGKPANPPKPYEFHGNTTTPQAAEYLRGWMAGREMLRNKRDDDSYLGSNDTNSDYAYS